jgi:hypothetical protein
MLNELNEELNRLMVEREEITAQIERLTTAIESVQELAAQQNYPIIESPPMSPDEETGFTERVRTILKANSSLALTAVIIRDEFLKATPKEDPKILLIHVHNTLKRLRKQGEVEDVTTSAGRGYRWKFVANSLWERLRSVGELASVPLDQNKLPEEIRGVVHPMDKLKAPKPPLTPAEAKRMMEFLRPKK